jgi:glucan phosphoethanolaminetransferase (alkaline phosphatase superfamily)
MSLKLFRSTGFQSILVPGETRVAVHPAWVVALVSLWTGLACNVLLWRTVGAGPQAQWSLCAVTAAFFAGTTAVVLGLLGWRRTLRPAATVMLFLAGLSACAAWQGLPADPARQFGFTLPAWPSLLRWDSVFGLVLLAVLPSVWVWNVRLRRIPGPRQLAINLETAAAGLALAGTAMLVHA